MGIPIRCVFKQKERDFARLIPILIPVNEPGPLLTEITLNFLSEIPVLLKISSIAGRRCFEEEKEGMLQEAKISSFLLKKTIPVGRAVSIPRINILPLF